MLLKINLGSIIGNKKWKGTIWRQHLKYNFLMQPNIKPGFIFLNCKVLWGKKFAFFQQILKFVCKRNKERNFALSLQKNWILSNFEFIIITIWVRWKIIYQNSNFLPFRKFKTWSIIIGRYYALTLRKKISRFVLFLL